MRHALLLHSYVKHAIKNCFRLQDSNSIRRGLCLIHLHSFMYLPYFAFIPRYLFQIHLMMSSLNDENGRLSGAQQMLAQKKQKTEMKLAIVTNSESVMQSPEVNVGLALGSLSTSQTNFPRCRRFESLQSAWNHQSIHLLELFVHCWSRRCVSFTKIFYRLIASGFCRNRKSHNRLVLLPQDRSLFVFRLLCRWKKRQKKSDFSKKICLRIIKSLSTCCTLFLAVSLSHVSLSGRFSSCAPSKGSAKNQKKSQRTKQYEKVHWNKVGMIVFFCQWSLFFCHLTRFTHTTLGRSYCCFEMCMSTARISPTIQLQWRIS